LAAGSVGAARGGARTWSATALVIAGAVALARGFLRAGDRAPAIALASFLCFASFSAGWVLFSAIGRLSGSRSMIALRPLAESAIGSVLVAPIGAVLLGLAGSFSLVADRPDLGGFMAPGTVAGRAVLVLALQAVAALAYVQASARAGIDPASEARASRLAGIYAVVFVAAQTFLGFDLVMALVPHFRSALLGAELAVTSFAAGVAGILILGRAGARREIRADDLGTFLTVLVALALYLVLTQWLTIWYGNLRDEVRGIVLMRRGSPWHGIAVLVLALMSLGPLSLLVVIRPLLPSFLRGPTALALVALSVLIGVWLERLLLVVGPAVTAGPRAVVGPAAIMGLGAIALHLGLAGIAHGRTLSAMERGR
jgi:hypothetical protein